MYYYLGNQTPRHWEFWKIQTDAKRHQSWNKHIRRLGQGISKFFCSSECNLNFAVLVWRVSYNCIKVWVYDDNGCYNGYHNGGIETKGLSYDRWHNRYGPLAFTWGQDILCLMWVACTAKVSSLPIQMGLLVQREFCHKGSNEYINLASVGLYLF